MKHIQSSIWNDTDELTKHPETTSRITERRWTGYTLPCAAPMIVRLPWSWWRRSPCREEEEDDRWRNSGTKMTTCGGSPPGSRRRRRTGKKISGGGGLGSRVDAPQKPNCRSPVQGPKRQGLRRHLPSRLSVRAEIRDGETFYAAKLTFWVFLSCVLYRSHQSPFIPTHVGEKRRRGSLTLE